MNGDPVTIDGTTWIKEITEHWSPGAVDGPTAYGVTFYDASDPEQWVCASRVPAASADLSEAGLRRLFYRAVERSWRDTRGRCWVVRSVHDGPGERPRGPCSDAAPLTSGGLISFVRDDGDGWRSFSRRLEAFPPLGVIEDEALRALLREARTPHGRN